MDIIRKDATITNTDDAGPGSFEVILSAPTLDRDGDTLKSDEWKQPLPDHITFDVDHGMSVASTVGSGAPHIDDEGRLIVAGTYSSLPRAQEVRTLVNEGHIKTTSVAFMTEKTKKDGKEATVRELLNGAFVAVPSNREALVLASKGIKAGARNSSVDAAMIQDIHDKTASLGADCSGAKAITESDVKSPTDNGAVATPSGDATPVDLAEVVKPDPDETATASAAGAADPAAAATAAAAGEDAQAAEDTALTLRVRSLSAFADGYTS